MAAPAPRRAAPATFWTMRRWPMRTALPPRRRAVAPELPEDVIVAVARYHDWAPPLLDMLATCKSWRKALLARGSEVWELIALRRFPRLSQMVAHRTGPLDYKALYAAQLGLEEMNKESKRQRLPASALPMLSDLIFTFELIWEMMVNPARGPISSGFMYPREVHPIVVGSWTGVFEDFNGGELETDAFTWTNDHVLNYLRLVTRPGLTEEQYARIPEGAHLDLYLRCIMTSRSDMTRTAVVYDAKLDQGPSEMLDPDCMFMFNHKRLPYERLLYEWKPHPPRRSEYQGHIYNHADDDESEGIIIMGDLRFWQEDTDGEELAGTETTRIKLVICGGGGGHVSDHNMLNGLVSCLPRRPKGSVYNPCWGDDTVPEYRVPPGLSGPRERRVLLEDIGGEEFVLKR